MPKKKTTTTTKAEKALLTGMLEAVEAGESYTILKADQPVAMVLPWADWTALQGKWLELLVPVPPASNELDDDEFDALHPLEQAMQNAMNAHPDADLPPVRRRREEVEIPDEPGDFSGYRPPGVFHQQGWSREGPVGFSYTLVSGTGENIETIPEGEASFPAGGGPGRPDPVAAAPLDLSTIAIADTAIAQRMRARAEIERDVEDRVDERLRINRRSNTPDSDIAVVVGGENQAADDVVRSAQRLGLLDTCECPVCQPGVNSP